MCTPSLKEAKSLRYFEKKLEKDMVAAPAEKRVVSQTIFVLQDKLCKAAPDPRLAFQKFLTWQQHYFSYRKTFLKLIRTAMLNPFPDKKLHIILSVTNIPK